MKTANKPIALGCIARDKLTGYEGVTVCRTVHLFNVVRWTLQPYGAKEGKAVEPYSFDEPSLDYVKDTDHIVVPPVRPNEHVFPGDVVREELTGLEGTVDSVSIFSNGCVRVAIQPRKLDKERKPVPRSIVDEKDLRVLKRGTWAEQAPSMTGGPRDEPRLSGR